MDKLADVIEEMIEGKLRDEDGSPYLENIEEIRFIDPQMEIVQEKRKDLARQISREIRLQVEQLIKIGVRNTSFG